MFLNPSLLKLSEISIQLNSYKGLFSAFDPNVYVERTLSDGFLLHAKKISKNKSGNKISLSFLLPENKRNVEEEKAIIVRIPELGDEAINGTISFVNPEILPQSKLNLIRVSIPNRNNKLKPGMSAYVYFSGAKHSSFTLPVDAVIRDSKGSTVWIKTGKNTFKNKMVEVGSEANGRIEIRSGLMPSDVVVITGAYLLNSEFIFKKGVNTMEGMKM